MYLIKILYQTINIPQKKKKKKKEKKIKIIYIFIIKLIIKYSY